jgi:hypothetical protein
MDSVKTKIRSALKACIKEITVAGGYNYSFTDVFDPAINMEQMSTYPTVNILYDEERRLGDRYKIGNNPLYDIMLPVQLDVFLNDVNDTSLAQDKVLADIQKYFGYNYYCKPSGGDRTLFELIWLSDTPWGTEREVPNCGISIVFELYYSIQVHNPYAMV